MTVTIEPAVEQLLHVDPTTLIIGANVRRTPDYVALVATVKERGVLQPITAYRDDPRVGADLGPLVVVRGQRRTLAAVEAGRETVPVYVIPAPSGVDTIVDQLAENDHRAGISTADRVAAFEQLTAVGLSAGQIAKRTATKRSDVDAGLRVVASSTAVATVQTIDLTLEQAATIAEFDGDEKAVATLVAAAQRGGFDHQAQRLLDAREEAQEIAAAAGELKDAGVKVVERISYNDRKAKRLDELKNGKQHFRADAHKGCPGHAAYVESHYVYDDTSKRNVAKVDPVYVCTDWKKHGHLERRGTAGPTTERTDQKEAATVERRRVIAGNKAWKSATAVRRKWLADFCHRKNAGDYDVERFIAEALIRNKGRFDEALHYQPHAFYLALVAGDSDNAGGAQHKAQLQKLTDEITTATRPRALAVTAGLILAAWEAKADDPQVWRQHKLSGTRYGDHDFYLAAMAAWGYELSSIELALVKHKAWVPE